MAAPQITVVNLRKLFLSAGEEATALDGANLTIDKGEYLAITGHSGSGKTTLLSILGGLLRPTSGSVSIDGCDIFGLSADGLARYRAEKVGFVFQSASLLPSLTVKDNLLLPSLYAPRRDKVRFEARALEYLSGIGLLHKAEAYPAQLSGGESRRVSLVRALTNGPEILLADEPTGDLDESSEAQVMILLETFHREMNTTLILVTHSEDIALRARRRLSMSRGRILEGPV